MNEKVWGRLLLLANYWLLWISLFFVALVAALCFTQVKLELFARRKKEDDDAKVTISVLFGFISYSFRLPQFRLNSQGIGIRLKKPGGDTTKHEVEVKDAITQYETWIEAIEIVRGFKAWFVKLLSKVELSDWKWHSYVGTGEAMSGALSCGALWSVKGMLFGTISRYVKVINPPEVAIEPQFQHKVFVSQWSCTLKLKLGSLLIAAIYLTIHAATVRKTKHLWRTLISRA